jgi:hypothetical protein
MFKKRALLISKISHENRKSGLSNRVQQISDFLNEMEFQVEVAPRATSSKSDNYDLICISSFSNASQIFRARSMSDFLWFDAMDSWRLTRKSLFIHDPLIEFVKLFREGFGRLFVRLPDLITYCSIRDSGADKSDADRTLIFGPVEMAKFELKDFGRRYVFVGPSTYFPNQEAVSFLFKLARLGFFQQTNLHIYGETGGYRDVHPDVFMHGLSDDVDIYGISDIHLVPIWRGAGIKYKTYFPLSMGIKVISTQEGANGFTLNPNLIVCDSKEQFMKAINEVEFKTNSNGVKISLLELDQREIIQARIAQRFNDLDRSTEG